MIARKNFLEKMLSFVHLYLVPQAPLSDKSYPNQYNECTVKKRRPHLSRSQAVGLLLLNTLVWGAALPISKPAFATTTPFQFLLYRFAFAALFSLPILGWYLWKHRALIAKVPIIIALELLGTTVALGLLYSGLSLTSSLEASLIAATTPLFTTLGGILYLREKEERHEWVGLAIALSGTLLLALEPLLTGRNSHATFSLTGNALIFLQNIAIAAYYVLAKKYYTGIPKFFATSISFYVGIVSFVALSMWNLGISLPALWNTAVFELSQVGVLIPALYMAVFGSIIGLTAYIWGQDGIEASEASLFTYLQPIVSIPIATLFLNERVTWPMLLAVVIIALGVMVGEMRWKQLRRKKRRPKKSS